MPSAEFSRRIRLPPSKLNPLAAPCSCARSLTKKSSSFGLSRRLGTLYLRRVVQAGRYPAYPRAPRTGAVHAADAYARSTGNVGVCLVTSGPGVTNAVTVLPRPTWIPSRSSSSAPGSYGRDRPGCIPGVDTVGITRPCVKHNFLVKDVRELAATVKKAFYIARTGRPGPVLIDIPKDVSKTPCKYEPLRRYRCVRTSGHEGPFGPDPQGRTVVVSAKRPYIYTGGGIILANAARELNQFADLLGYPVTNTLMGLAVIARTTRNSSACSACTARTSQHGDATLRRADRDRRAFR